MSAATVATDALLALGVASTWLAAFGLFRLPSAHARLHCVGFAGAAGGVCFTAAVLVDQGGTPLGFKSIAAALFLLMSGALLVHITGRALRLRQEGGEYE